MAAKNSRNGNTKTDWQGEFIDIRLLSDEREAFSAWVEKQGEDLSVEVGVLISNGWKTSITWDERNVCFIAASTMKDENDKNYNCVVSSRSENFYEALALNAYKINVLHKNADLRKVGSTNNWG